MMEFLQKETEEDPLRFPINNKLTAIFLNARENVHKRIQKKYICKIAAKTVFMKTKEDSNHLTNQHVLTSLDCNIYLHTFAS